MTELDPYGRCYIGSCHVKDSSTELPVTGDGDNPLAILRIDLPPIEPKSIADYMAWVEFRTDSVRRFIDSGETKLARETIARLEGDLLQLRMLLRVGQTLVEG